MLRFMILVAWLVVLMGSIPAGAESLCLVDPAAWDESACALYIFDCAEAGDLGLIVDGPFPSLEKAVTAADGLEEGCRARVEERDEALDHVACLWLPDDLAACDLVVASCWAQQMPPGWTLFHGPVPTRDQAYQMAFEFEDGCRAEQDRQSRSGPGVCVWTPVDIDDCRHVAAPCAEPELPLDWVVIDGPFDGMETALARANELALACDSALEMQHPIAGSVPCVAYCAAAERLDMALCAETPEGLQPVSGAPCPAGWLAFPVLLGTNLLPLVREILSSPSDQALPQLAN